MKLCWVARNKPLQHFDLPCNHFQFQVLNSTIVQPPHPIPIDDSEIRDGLAFCNFTQRANFTVLRGVRSTFKIWEGSYYLAQYGTFPNLGLHFDHSPVSHSFGLHHSSYLNDNAILNHDALPLVRGCLALKPNRASLTNDTIAAHRYRCMSRTELCSRVNDRVGAQCYEMCASERGVFGDGKGGCKRGRWFWWSGHRRGTFGRHCAGRIRCQL